MYRYLLAVLLSAYASTSFSAPVALEGIAAIVDENVVLQSELQQRLADIRYQYTTRQQTLPPDDVLKRQVLEQLILERIQLSQLNARACVLTTTALMLLLLILPLKTP
jgi:peptidyl-prolyl cis-trans isomerase SurA